MNSHALIKWKMIFVKMLLMMTATCKHLLIYTEFIVLTYLSHSINEKNNADMEIINIHIVCKANI